MSHPCLAFYIFTFLQVVEEVLRDGDFRLVPLDWAGRFLPGIGPGMEAPGHSAGFQTLTSFQSCKRIGDD